MKPGDLSTRPYSYPSDHTHTLHIITISLIYSNHNHTISYTNNPSLLLQPIINRLLRSKPSGNHLPISKRQHLTRNNPRNALLPINPIEQIRNPRPPRRIRTPPRRTRRNRQKPTQSPPLRRIPLLRIHFRYRVDELGVRWWRTSTRKVRMLGDLVLEHFVYGFGGEDLGAGAGAGAVVKEGCEELDVLAWFGEETGAARVEEGGLLLFGVLLEGAAVGVVRLDEISGRGVALVHVCEVGPHFLGGEHGHVGDFEGGEDVFLEVVVEFLARGALEDYAGPVEVYLWMVSGCGR